MNWVQMAGSQRAVRRLSTLTLLGMTGLVLSQACDPAGGDDTGVGLDSEDLAQLLAAVGPEVVLPALEEFVAEMTTLEDSLESLESSLQTEDEADARIAAQVQWGVAMQRWQVLEVLQIGPAPIEGAAALPSGVRPGAAGGAAPVSAVASGASSLPSVTGSMHITTKTRR